MKLRDDGFEPKLKRQVLIYPATQFADYRLPSYQQNKAAPMLKDRHMGFFASLYLFGKPNITALIMRNEHITKDALDTIRKNYIPYGGLPKNFLELGPYVKLEVEGGDAAVWDSIKEKVMDPYMSPLFAKTLERLPDAFVATCQYDVLRDEGYLYAERLRKAGVVVKYINYDTGFHGMISLFAMIKEGGDLMSDMIEYLKKEL